jgi:hypothetical protein
MNPKVSKNHLSNFSSLHNQEFGKYVFVYHINDCYSINEIDNIKTKNQLFLQKIRNRTQQHNLMLVDSVFLSFLSDLTVEVLLGKASCFADYVYKKRCFSILPKLNNYKYLFYKFTIFTDLLLFSDIANKKPSKGEWDSNKIYYLKQEQEIEYYRLLMSKEQRDFLLKHLKVRIVNDESFIKGKTVTITLQIYT